VKIPRTACRACLLLSVLAAVLASGLYRLLPGMSQEVPFTYQEFSGDQEPVTTIMVVPTGLAVAFGIACLAGLALGILGLAWLTRSRLWLATGLALLADGILSIANAGVDGSAGLSILAKIQAGVGGLAYLLLGTALIVRREDAHPAAGWAAAGLVGLSFAATYYFFLPIGWDLPPWISLVSGYLVDLMCVGLAVFLALAWRKNRATPPSPSRTTSIGFN
jgi:hypothetical protein